LLKILFGHYKYFCFLALIFLLVPIRLPEGLPQSSEAKLLAVGVAQWRYEGGARLDVQERAYIQLITELDAAGVEDIYVTKLPVALDTARDIDRVAAQFEVDIILWGWYDQVATRSYVDLADATDANGLTNSLDAFLKNGGPTQSIRVLKILSEFDYLETGLYFCVPRWTP
jgi:hypothetical protein